MTQSGQSGTAVRVDLIEERLDAEEALRQREVTSDLDDLEDGFVTPVKAYSERKRIG